MNTSGLGSNEEQSIIKCTEAGNKVYLRHCLHLFLFAVNCYTDRWDCPTMKNNADNVIQALNHE